MRTITFTCIQLGPTSQADHPSSADGAADESDNAEAKAAEPGIADIDVALAIARSAAGADADASLSSTPDAIMRARQPIDAIIILICDEIAEEVSASGADALDAVPESDQSRTSDTSGSGEQGAPAGQRSKDIDVDMDIDIDIDIDMDIGIESNVGIDSDSDSEAANTASAPRAGPFTYRFALRTLCRSEGHDERDLITALDLELALSTLFPSSNIITMDSCSQLLFYRGLRHRIPLYYLGGTPTPEGRKFGDTVYPAGPDTAWANFSQVCDLLDIPFAATLLAHLETPGHTDALTCLCEAGAIFVAALWLQVLLHEYPGDPDRVTRAWEAFGAWVAADPALAHLLPLVAPDREERG